MSACLAGAPVRYDGRDKRDAFLVDELGRRAELVSVCPEVEIGLGVPRETLQLVRRDGELRLETTATRIDHTDAMRAFATRRADELAALDLDGYVWKSRSPSCSLAGVAVAGGASDERARGLFAEAVTRRMPCLPVAEETDLADVSRREAFLARVDAWHELRRAYALRYHRAMPHLGDRFADALAFAHQLHATQRRKGTDVPYVAHLMSVAALVLEDGGDEDQAIAGLLHDAVEDQGGAPTRETIRARFGERVTAIVDGCSDTDETPKPPWRARKERYIAHLATATVDVRRVSLADKVHNARSIVADLRRHGAALWDRFSGGKGGTLWYYRAIVDAFRVHGASWLHQELARTVDEMEQLAGPQSQPEREG